MRTTSYRSPPGFRYAEKVTPGPVVLGSAFNTSARGLGPMQIEIVEYERPTRLGFVGRARPVVMHHHLCSRLTVGALGLTNK